FVVVLVSGCVERALPIPLFAPLDDLARVDDLFTMATLDLRAPPDLAPPLDLTFVPGPHSLRCKGGADSVCVVLPMPLDRPRELTVELWFRSTDTRTHFGATIFEVGMMNAGFRRDSFEPNAKTEIFVSALLAPFDPRPLATGAWHHLAAQ